MWCQTHTKREENATIRKIHYHETDVDEKIVHRNLTYQLNLSSLSEYNMMHLGLCRHYHTHCNPLHGVVHKSVRRILCFCKSLIEAIKSEWLEGKETEEQPSAQRNVHFKYA